MLPPPAPSVASKPPKQPLISREEVNYALSKLRKGRKNGLVLGHKEVVRLALELLVRAMGSEDPRLAIHAAHSVLRMPRVRHRVGDVDLKPRSAEKKLKTADAEIAALASEIGE